MARLAVWTVALEGLCLWIFVAVASTAWALPGKQLAIAAGVAVAGLVTWSASARASLRAALAYAALVAVGNVAVDAVLAFTRYPGLAKDLAFASVDHARQSTMLLSLSFAGHLALLLGMRLVRRLSEFEPAADSELPHRK